MTCTDRSIITALHERVLDAERRHAKGTPTPIVLLEGTGAVSQTSAKPSERLMYLAACEGTSVPNTLAKIVHDMLGLEFAVRYESESRGNAYHWRFVLIKR